MCMWSILLYLSSWNTIWCRNKTSMLYRLLPPDNSTSWLCERPTGASVVPAAWCWAAIEGDNGQFGVEVTTMAEVEANVFDVVVVSSSTAAIIIAFDALRLNCSRKLSICMSIFEDNGVADHFRSFSTLSIGQTQIGFIYVLGCTVHNFAARLKLYITTFKQIL